MMEACATCDMTGTGVLCWARERNAPGLCDPMHRETVNKMSRGVEPPAGTGTQAPKAKAQRPPCVHLGGPVLGPDGGPVMRDCRTCTGNVRLKVFGCDHPAHGETTAKQCRECPDYEAKREPLDPALHGTLPVAMVAPGQPRPVWRGGIIQVMVTRACDLACIHCTQGSNLAGKPAMMTVEEFDRACASLEGYPGVVGMFGGNPAMHPKFGELCQIMRARFPFEQRGLWCNNLRGQGAHARITFNPRHSNINVHLSGAAAEEFRRDWPEAAPFIKGEGTDSMHGSPWVALKDVVLDEAERWKMIGDCDINKFWSAAVGVVPGRGLRVYFCELAYAQAALHADDPEWPDTGLPAEPGWWRLPMAAFEAQVRLHCMSCGIPLRRPGQLAVGGEREEFSETHRAIARPKAKGRAISFVGVEALERPDRPATDYLPGTTPKVRV